jgi:hypothetical protein
VRGTWIGEFRVSNIFFREILDFKCIYDHNTSKSNARALKSKKVRITTKNIHIELRYNS